MIETTYTKQDSNFTLNNPTKTGYNFTGWSGSHLEGEDNIIEVNITVSVLILEEVAKLSCNNGNEAYESALENDLVPTLDLPKLGIDGMFGEEDADTEADKVEED